MVSTREVYRRAATLSASLNIPEVNLPRADRLSGLRNQCYLLGYLPNLFREYTRARLLQLLLGLKELHDARNSTGILARLSVQRQAQQLVSSTSMANAKADILSHLRGNLTQLLCVVSPLQQSLVGHLLSGHELRVHKLQPQLHARVHSHAATQSNRAGRGRHSDSAQSLGANLLHVLNGASILSRGHKGRRLPKSFKSRVYDSPLRSEHSKLSALGHKLISDKQSSSYSTAKPACRSNRYTTLDTSVGAFVPN